jgi:alginate O-acetyltransferase complex protein AlgJ
VQRRFQLSRLPVVIGVTILLIPWFCLTWNITIGEVVPQLRFRTKHTVAGVIEEAAQDMSFEGVLSSRYQTYVSKRIGRLTPIYKPSIRWKNQFYYSLLGTSGTRSILIGRQGELFSAEYVEEYCARDTAQLRPRAEAWAEKLARTQRFFEARGKVFLYVTTPSKPAVYPEYLPPSYKCPATSEDRLHKLEVYRSILDRYHIHYVDAATLTAQARASYPIDLFPRGGIHWNMLGATLAAQAITQAVNRQSRSPLLTPFTFTWQTSFEPRVSDKDLLEIMNLRWPDEHYPVPVPTIESKPPKGACQPARVTEVGGSFLFTINAVLEEAACPPVIQYWFYWEKKHFIFDEGPAKKSIFDPSYREISNEVPLRDRELLTDLDVILFEENEAAMPESSHGQQFFDFIAAREAGMGS